MARSTKRLWTLLQKALPHQGCWAISDWGSVGDFQVPCSYHFQQLRDIWSYCGTEQCYLKAVCNLVVELMHNTVNQRVTVFFTITDYSFFVLRMNQHMTCEAVENHWNKFSCSWLRFTFFVIEQDVCFHYAVIVWLVTLSSLIIVLQKK